MQLHGDVISNYTSRRIEWKQEKNKLQPGNVKRKFTVTLQHSHLELEQQ